VVLLELELPLLECVVPLLELELLLLECAVPLLELEVLLLELEVPPLELVVPLELAVPPPELEVLLDPLPGLDWPPPLLLLPRVPVPVEVGALPPDCPAPPPAPEDLDFDEQHGVATHTTAARATAYEWDAVLIDCPPLGLLR
jgi:hypothetical protein